MPYLPPTRQLTHNEQAICNSSIKTVQDLDKLAQNDSFRDFMQRLQRRADELADEVLNNEMDAVKREALRHHRLGILEVLRVPKEDREASVRTLAAYGITVGDAPQ